MSILGTFNGVTIISLPSDTMPVVAPSSIEWETTEFTAKNVSPYTGQTQYYDWMNSMWKGTITFNHMDAYSSRQWKSFILSGRGGINAFMFGDPRSTIPFGTALGNGVVYGSSQTGYSLLTNGWKANQPALLMAGDYIQIGYRLYSLTAPASSDSGGNATLSIWPNLRDSPTSGTGIQVYNCKGLFRLANTSNKFSVTSGSFSIDAISIIEAI